MKIRWTLPWPRYLGTCCTPGAFFPNSFLPALPPRCDTGAWHYDHGARAEPFVVTGCIFTDGSCKKLVPWKIAARAGWCFVVVGDASYSGAAFDALPGPRQTSLGTRRAARCAAGSHD
eukprot:499244-Pyramimonas_sp.AAC.1